MQPQFKLKEFVPKVEQPSTSHCTHAMLGTAVRGQQCTTAQTFQPFEKEFVFVAYLLS